MSVGKVNVYFGGTLHERWTNDGLDVSYTGRLGVLAVREGGAWRAMPMASERAGDVKADYNESSRSAELASRLNSGAVPALTSAYFSAAATVAALSGELPDEQNVLDGTLDAVILPELLRMLLDERHMGWDESVDIISKRFDARMSGNSALPALPLDALAAIQPRTAELITAVNEKLCNRLWDAFPGDWRRIGESAILRDGEFYTEALCAAMCGRIFCTKERRTSSLRSMYTLQAAKFTDI